MKNFIKEVASFIDTLVVSMGFIAALLLALENYVPMF